MGRLIDIGAHRQRFYRKYSGRPKINHPAKKTAKKKDRVRWSHTLLSIAH